MTTPHTEPTTTIEQDVATMKALCQALNEHQLIIPESYVPAIDRVLAEVERLQMANAKYHAFLDAHPDIKKQFVEHEYGEGVIERGLARIQEMYNRLNTELAELRERCEQLQVQLAGCGVAALGGISESQLAKRGDYGWSASYQDVVNLRARLNAAEERGWIAGIGSALKIIETKEKWKAKELYQTLEVLPYPNVSSDNSQHTAQPAKEKE